MSNETSDEPLRLGELDARATLDLIAAGVADQGVAHYEIYLLSSASLEVEMEKGSLKNAQVKRETGFSVRVALDGGRVGFSCNNIFSRDGIETTIHRAIDIANASTPDADFKAFADISEISYLPKELLFDIAVERLEIDDGVRIVAETLDDTLSTSDPRMYSINISFSADSEQIFIVNSNGVDVSEAGTSAGLSCVVTVKDGDEMNSDYDFCHGRSLDQVRTGVGSGAARRALKTLGKQDIGTGYYQVVMSPRAVASVIGASLAHAANAETIQQKMSFLHDKIGNQIAPAFVSVVDDARMETGSRTGTRSFDDEGFRSGRTAIIDHGILSGILHNSYTANKAGVENSGNAGRTGYDTPPRIAQSNLLLVADPDHVAGAGELVGDIGHGIYFDQTGDSASLATGDFSGMIASGFSIENGEITTPIRQAAFGINLLALLDAIELCSAEVEDIGGIIVPSIRVKGINISGNL
jgi:PmbA protein